MQEQQRQKDNSQTTGPQQWPDVLPLSSLAIKPAHPPVFKAEDLGLDDEYFMQASEARAVDGTRNNAPENALNDETNNTPSLAKAQAIMQQLQPEEAALLAHMQASFNAVANKIKQASNDARLNPFKEPTPPPQGSARQVRIRYYHCDQLGTPKELTSSTGELVWYAQYKAWGNTVKVEWLQGPAGQEVGFEWGQVEGASSTGNSSRAIQSHKQTQAQVQPIRFQGQYYDWETGLHYNRFRYYDPDCGRFICKDPIGLAGGLNLFQYAPNPVGWVDPFGLMGYRVANRNIVTDKVEIGKRLSDKQAINRTQRGQDVYADSRSEALSLSKKCACEIPMKHEPHPNPKTGSTEGRLPHIHPNNHIGTVGKSHIFFPKY